MYSYDGRLLSTPKFAGLRAETLSAQTVALGPDCVAIVDRTDGKSAYSRSRVLVCSVSRCVSVASPTLVSSLCSCARV